MVNKIKIEPQWGKSKEVIWDQAFSGLEDDKSQKRFSLRKKIAWYYVAASVAVIAVLLPCIAFTYTKNIAVAKGNYLSVVLPDGSKVDLNADSKISYKPLWWFVVRDVQLEGEAYFEVKKGSTFNVHTSQYTTSVLGTSFNVFSRDERLVVTCLTGKVKVSGRQQAVFLTPDMKAIVNKGKLKEENITNAQQTAEWRHGKFFFISVPLPEVIEEIERQYNIKVVTDSNLDYLYSGNFTKTNYPEDILDIVGRPFGIEFKIK